MEGDEDPCKPLAAKETRKMTSQKIARWQFAIRRNARRRLRSGCKFMFIALFLLKF